MARVKVFPTKDSRLNAANYCNANLVELLIGGEDGIWNLDLLFVYLLNVMSKSIPFIYE